MTVGGGGQAELFPGVVGSREVVVINGRCCLRLEGQQRVVTVAGLPVHHDKGGDRLAEAYAMVTLVGQGYARQTEVVLAFGCDVRTVRRRQCRFVAGGLAALGRPSGYPEGRPRVAVSRDETVSRLKAEGAPTREIARWLGIDEKAVRKTLRRLGWGAATQGVLPFEGADPKVSGSATGVEPQAREEAFGDRPDGGRPSGEDRRLGADQNLSGVAAVEDDPAPPSADRDPADRSVDRLLACLGVLDDAAPLFRPGTAVPGAGVLLALPALRGQRRVRRAPARSTAASARRSTGCAPRSWSPAPDGAVAHQAPRGAQGAFARGARPACSGWTVRRRSRRCAASSRGWPALGRAAEFGRALAERGSRTRGDAMGFLYVDGHVRVYHGRRTLPKAHVARMRLSMPATTDYWVNDAEGEPLFVVTAEANAGLVKMLPALLAEVRAPGRRAPRHRRLRPRRLEPEALRQADRGRLRHAHLPQGPLPPRARSALQPTTRRPSTAARCAYTLADQGVRSAGGKLRLRQVTRLSEDGHQTPILTSRRDLPAVEVAYRMFERWRQENFFKYLREEYALDALVDYAVEPDDPTREVPNPVRAAARRRSCARPRPSSPRLQPRYGAEALANRERRRPTMRGFKIANAELGQPDPRRRCATVRSTSSAAVPRRVPVQQVVPGRGRQARHRAQAPHQPAQDGRLPGRERPLPPGQPHYRRAEDEGRTLIQSALATSGDLEIVDDTLVVRLDPLSAPHRTAALAAICADLSATRTRFPGSSLRLRFEVKPPPPQSPAFPGPCQRPTPPAPNRTSRPRGRSGGLDSSRSLKACLR